MSAKKSNKKDGFSWKTSSFLLLVLAGAIIAYSTHKHGSFEATSIGKFLKNSELLAFIHKIWVLAKLYHTTSIEYLKCNFPEFYKASANFSKPYISLAMDFYLIAKNFLIKLYENLATYINQKSPAIVQAIEHYIPGLLDATNKNSLRALEIIKIYSGWLAEQTIENFVRATKWFKTNIFVGKLSPVGLQNYATSIINTTHTFTSQTFDWLYKKMHNF